MLCQGCHRSIAFPEQWFSETCPGTDRGHALTQLQILKGTVLAKVGVLEKVMEG